MRAWGLLLFALSSAADVSNKTCEDLHWPVKSGQVCGATVQVGGVCVTERTKAEAQALCEGQGARLCTIVEINKGTVASTGCQLDKKRIWSSTPCVANPDWFSTVGGGGTGFTGSPPRGCTNPANLAFVRCCADAGPPTAEAPSSRQNQEPTPNPSATKRTPSAPSSPRTANTTTSSPPSTSSNSTDTPVNSSVTFTVPFSLISNDTNGVVDFASSSVKNFAKNFSAEFSRAVSISESRIVVHALRRGSIITDFSIAGSHDSEKSAAQANTEMGQLVANRSSRLYTSDFFLFSHADPTSYHATATQPSPSAVATTTNSQAQPESSSGLSGGAIAGIVIVVLLVVLLCLASCFFPGQPKFWAWHLCQIWLSQRRKGDSTPGEYDPDAMHKSSTFVHVQGAKGANVQTPEDQHLIHQPETEATGPDPDADTPLVVHPTERRSPGPELESNKSYWVSDLGAADTPLGPGDPAAPPPPDPSVTGGMPRSDSELVVREALSHAAPAPKHPPEEVWALSLFDFHTDDSEDLSFKAHQWIKVLSQELDLGEDWWMGELEDGRSGTFPHTYVRLESVLQEFQSRGG